MASHRGSRCRERQLRARSFRHSECRSRRPKVGAELRKQAIYVTLYALGGMLYILPSDSSGSIGAACRSGRLS